MKSQGLQIPVGNTVTIGRVAGMIVANTTVYNDSGTGVGTFQNLGSFVLKGKSLLTIGDRLKIHTWGKFPAQTVLSFVVAEVDVNGVSLVGTAHGSLVSVAPVVATDALVWEIDIDMVASVIGASGVLLYTACLSITDTGAASINDKIQVGNASVTLDLTADQTFQVKSKVTGTGGTPWATEYALLCDYNPVP